MVHLVNPSEFQTETLPGTGLSSRTKIAGGNAEPSAAPSSDTQTPDPAPRVNGQAAKSGGTFFMVVGLIAVFGFVFWLVAG